MATEYTEDERKAIRWASALARVDSSDLKKLGHQNSRRGRQRAVALLLGFADSQGEFRAYKLRDILTDLGIYNQANFAQDMTKDSTDAERGRGPEDGLWEQHVYRGRGLHGYWRLTPRGRKLAEEYAKLVDRGVETARVAVSRSFVIKARAISCPFCRDKITPEDRSVCNAKCGSEAHASCLVEFGHPCDTCDGSGLDDEKTCETCHGTGRSREVPCALSRTTVRCKGEYANVALPKRRTSVKLDRDGSNG